MIEKLDNITRHLKEEIEKERECMERCAEHKDYDTANICQQRIIAYEKAIEKQNGKRIAFVRQSDTMVLILKICAVLNIGACVFSTFNKHYIVALLDLIVSFFTYSISTYVERNNEVFDFFDNSENNLNK